MTIAKNAGVPRLSAQQAAALGGREITIELDIADAASDDYDLAVEEAIEVLDVTVIKNGGGAGNTLTVKNGANAISDAIAAAVDKAVTRAGTIDRAQSTIAAGGTLRLSVNRAAGSGALRVFVFCVSRSSINTIATAP